MAIKYQPINPEFQSAEELFKYIENTPRAPGWVCAGDGHMGRQASSDERGSYKRNWTGCESLSEAINLGRNGWADGLKKLTQKMELIRAQTDKARRKSDVWGDYPIVGKFLANQPDCMSRRTRGESCKRPIVEIVMNMCYSSGVSADTIMNIGAAVAVLIDELENSGYSVSLVVYSVSEMCRTYVGQSTEIKQPGEILDLAKLIFFVAHPSALRRIGFFVWETIISGADMPSGYGMIHTKTSQPGTINFPAVSGNSHGATPESAIAYVHNLVKEQRPDVLPGADTTQAA